MSFLKEYFHEEYDNFLARIESQEQSAPSELALRRWASLRTQTLYRTVAGMMSKRRALKLLLHAQLPELGAAQCDELADAKFTCMVAMQRYGELSPEELDDAEELLRDFPSLKIAFWR